MYFYKIKIDNKNLKNCAEFELIFCNKEDFIQKTIILNDEKIIKKFLIFLMILRDKRLTEFDDFDNEYFKNLMSSLKSEVFTFENKVLLDIFNEYKLVTFLEEFYDENGYRETIMRFFSESENKFFEDVENYFKPSTQCKIYERKYNEQN